MVVEMLEVERRRPPPPAEDLDRAFARISATVGLADGGTGDSGAGGDPGAGGPSAGPAGTGVEGADPGLLSRAIDVAIKPATIVAFVAGALGGAGTHALLGQSDTPRTVAVGEAAPRVVAERSDRVGPAPLPPFGSAARASADRRLPPRAEQPRPRATVRRRRAKRARPTTLAAERALIEMARTALARGRAEDALAALDLARRKGGQLAEEREALAVIALANLGRRLAACRRARLFFRRHPRSLLSRVVKEAVQPRGQPVRTSAKRDLSRTCRFR
jgi:hypothetical protein